MAFPKTEFLYQTTFVLCISQVTIIVLLYLTTGNFVQLMLYLGIEHV